MSEAVKILVIESSRLEARLLEIILSIGPFRVRVVSDGQLALNTVQTEHPPQIVICDLHLPRIEGIHIIQIIRKNQQWQALPIIAMSENIDTSTVNQAMAAGATVVLAKPYHPERLQQEVFRLTGYERVDK